MSTTFGIKIPNIKEPVKVAFRHNIGKGPHTDIIGVFSSKKLAKKACTPSEPFTAQFGSATNKSIIKEFEVQDSKEINDQELSSHEINENLEQS